MSRRISIGKLLVNVGKFIFANLRPLAINYLNDLALEVVTEVSKLNLSSNEEKKAAALQLLNSKLSKLNPRTFKARFPGGIKDSLKAFLIELAVQRFKSGVAIEAAQITTDE